MQLLQRHSLTRSFGFWDVCLGQCVTSLLVAATRLSFASIVVSLNSKAYVYRQGAGALCSPCEGTHRARPSRLWARAGCAQTSSAAANTQPCKCDKVVLQRPSVSLLSLPSPRLPPGYHTPHPKARLGRCADIHRQHQHTTMNLTSSPNELLYVGFNQDNGTLATRDTHTHVYTDACAACSVCRLLCLWHRHWVSHLQLQPFPRDFSAR